MRKMPADELKMYQRFIDEFPFCMARGITQEFGFDHARGWNTGYSCKIENAHILGGPQRKQHGKSDRRNLLRLSVLAHKLSHDYNIRWNDGHFPKLSRANLLWIKQVRDPEFYDIDFLNSISIQKMPEPEKPPAWFEEQFQINQPVIWKLEQTAARDSN